jgi:3',5'-cyclic AMP phosphodiesterase CpdA
MRILHLSDIHFGIYTDHKTGALTAAHYFVDSSKLTPVPGQLSRLLLDNVLPPPDLVVISGDIGWSGTSADYKYALAFLKPLRDAWTDAEFVLAPGNHDVDLDTAPRQAAYVEFVREFYGSSFSST